jgi:hypothetical protein
MHRQLRLGSWLALVLCFFLPFARGCDDNAVSAQSLLSPGNCLIFGLPFLYPIFVLAIGRTKRWWAAVPENAERSLRVYWAHLALLFATIGQWIWALRDSERGSAELTFMAGAAALGLFALSRLGRVTTHTVLKTVERQQSGFSLMSMIYFCTLAGWESVLWGGWLALCSSGLSWWLSLK